MSALLLQYNVLTATLPYPCIRHHASFLALVTAGHIFTTCRGPNMTLKGRLAIMSDLEAPTSL